MFYNGSSSCRLQGSYNIYNENPSSSGQANENSSALMHFPTSFLDEDDEVLVARWLSENKQQQEVLMGSSTLAETEGSFVVAKEGSTNAKKDESKGNVDAEAEDQERVTKEVDMKKSSKSTKKSAPRKRSGKKDRHSKIYTAQGPRDRRMRLSVQISRKFFDLQDMLGFDKASKTIEWLLTRSKSAIKELTKNFQQVNPRFSNGTKSMSSTSENEVVSGIKKCDTTPKANQDSSSMAKPNEKKERLRAQRAPRSPVAKESRDKARERARERTREKMKNKEIQEKPKQSSVQNPSDYLKQKLDGSMESTNQDMNSVLTAIVNEKEFNRIQLPVAEGDPQLDSLSMIENFYGLAMPTVSSSTGASAYPSFTVSSSTNFKDAHPGNSEIDKAKVLNNYHCGTNLKHPVSGNVHVQLPAPHSSFTSQTVRYPCVQGYNTLAQRYNPRAMFRNISNAEERNPDLFCQEQFNNPAYMNAPDVYLQRDQLYCNPISISRNDSWF